MAKRLRRQAVRQTTFTVPAASGSQGFDSLVMQGICVACKHPFKNHFNQQGAFVGCNPNEKAGDEFVQAAVFVPPVIIPSAVLIQLIQTRSGAVVVQHPSSAPAPNGPLPVKFGRPADMYYPVVENIEPGYGERIRAVFEKLAAHRENGVTLRQLVTEVGMPYSTVQSQINKLVSIKAAERRSPTAA